MAMDNKQLCNIIEGALLASASPMNIAGIAALFEDEERPSSDEIRAALDDIRAACSGRGFELNEVASGWRFQVRQEMAPWVNRLWEEKPARYTRASLETLALIAYRQPITRGDIEEIRGVAVSSSIIKSFLERGWVRIVGHRDVPGRPALYATTRQFLDYFNLKSLDALPSLAELKDFDSLNNELVFDGSGEQGEAAVSSSTAEEATAETASQTETETGSGIEAADESPEATLEEARQEIPDEDETGEPVAEPSEVTDEEADEETQPAVSEARERSLSDVIGAHISDDVEISGDDVLH